MKKEIASLVRRHLSTLLRDIFDTEENLGIDLSGEVVAILTLKKPRQSIEPIRVKIEDAKKGWSELLQAVSMKGARFYFYIKGDEKASRIYLLPNPDFENSFAKRWVEHVREEKAKNVDGQVSNRDLLEAQSDTKHKITSLKEALEKLDRKITHTFTLMSRDGDIFRTPEQGTARLTNDEDLDRYEVD